MKVLSVLAAIILALGLLTGCKSAGDRLAMQGVTAYANGNYTDAIDLLKKADTRGLSQYKEDELDLYLANSYLRNGDYDSAIDCCNKIIGETTNEVRLLGAYNTMGTAQVKQKKLTDALASFQSALKYDKSDSNSIGLYENLGTLYIQLNQPLNAITYLTKIINIDKTFADAYGNLAIAYATLFDFDSADKALADAKTEGYKNVDSVQQIIDKYRNFGKTSTQSSQPETETPTATTTLAVTT
jgi:tetratricopeptide (TPR) repeat protein